MVSGSNEENGREISDELMSSLPWDLEPLCLLNENQQKKIKQKAEIRFYKMGGKIWPNENSEEHFLIISGKVRLRDEMAKKPIATLTGGDWFGDLLNLSGEYKAVASGEVVVICWKVSVWNEITQKKLHEVWQENKEYLVPETPQIPEPVQGYPFVSGLNTAACCLTMISQELQVSAQLEWVQKQLRGESPKNLIDGAEKLGFQLRRVIVKWEELSRLSFPALIHWYEETWVVVYAIRGDRLIIGNPLNPGQTCESLPRKLVEKAWDGQVWLVELNQKQEKFNLTWFLPAVWRYRGLLSEVLFASITLQLLGLTTPVITQVIIDKVMVQESLATLDVMAI
ncbi:MAG TPA: cysteine peptidase family C39 domain-containing protein, partial [Allocoleopsis sp.]